MAFDPTTAGAVEIFDPVKAGAVEIFDPVAAGAVALDDGSGVSESQRLRERGGKVIDHILFSGKDIEESGAVFQADVATQILDDFDDPQDMRTRLESRLLLSYLFEVPLENIQSMETSMLKQLYGPALTDISSSVVHRNLKDDALNALKEIPQNLKIGTIGLTASVLEAVKRRAILLVSAAPAEDIEILKMFEAHTPPPKVSGDGLVATEGMIDLPVNNKRVLVTMGGDPVRRETDIEILRREIGFRPEDSVRLPGTIGAEAIAVVNRLPDIGGKILRGKQRKLQEVQDIATIRTSPITTGARLVVQGGIPSRAVALGAAVLTGNPLIGLVILGELEGGAAFQRQLEGGGSIAKAQLIGDLSAAAEIVGEALVFPKMVRGLTQGVTLADGLMLMGENAFQEAFTGFNQQFLETYGLETSKGTPIKEAAQLAFDAGIDAVPPSAFVGFATAGLSNSVSQLTSQPAKIRAQRRIVADLIAQGIDEGRAKTIARDIVRGDGTRAEAMLNTMNDDARRRAFTGLVTAKEAIFTGSTPPVMTNALAQQAEDAAAKRAAEPKPEVEVAGPEAAATGNQIDSRVDRILELIEQSKTEKDVDVLVDIADQIEILDVEIEELKETEGALESMTLKQLRKTAKKLDIPVPKGAGKARTIEVIRFGDITALNNLGKKAGLSVEFIDGEFVVTDIIKRGEAGTASVVRKFGNLTAAKQHMIDRAVIKTTEAEDAVAAETIKEEMEEAQIAGKLDFQEASDELREVLAQRQEVRTREQELIETREVDKQTAKPEAVEEKVGPISEVRTPEGSIRSPKETDFIESIEQEIKSQDKNIINLAEKHLQAEISGTPLSRKERITEAREAGITKTSGEGSLAEYHKVFRSLQFNEKNKGKEILNVEARNDAFSQSINQSLGGLKKLHGIVEVESNYYRLPDGRTLRVSNHAPLGLAGQTADINISPEKSSQSSFVPDDIFIVKVFDAPSASNASSGRSSEVKSVNEALQVLANETGAEVDIAPKAVEAKPEAVEGEVTLPATLPTDTKIETVKEPAETRQEGLPFSADRTATEFEIITLAENPTTEQRNDLLDSGWKQFSKEPKRWFNERRETIKPTPTTKPAEVAKPPGPKVDNKKFNNQLETVSTSEDPDSVNVDTEEVDTLFDTPEKDMGQEWYDNNTDKYKKTVGQKTKSAAAGIVKGIDRVIGVTSTRLNNISPLLFRQTRRYEFNVMTRTTEQTKRIDPFLKLTKKLDKNTLRELDLAFKNSDGTKIKEIVEANDMVEEFRELRKVLDELYKAGNDVGLDIDYRKNYMPRQVKDSKGFLEHFQKGDDWSIIRSAIETKEKQRGRTLNETERAAVVNTLLRGYKTSALTLTAPGASKERTVKVVDAVINQFYHDFRTSLTGYIRNLNEKIAAREFFGRQSKEITNLRARKSRALTRLAKLGTRQGLTEGATEEKFDEHISRTKERLEEINEKLERLGADDLTNTIGQHVIDMVVAKEILPSQEKEVRDLLMGLFDPSGDGGLLGAFRTLTYIDVLGSPLNAITQLEELGLSFYRDPGLGFITETVKAMLNLSEISTQDIGVTSVGEEFFDADFKKALSTIMTVTGFEKIDKVGKQTFINTALRQMRKQARSGSKTLTDRLQRVFGDEQGQVLADLKSGEVTDNIKYLVFNQLLDIQPLALTEMPEAYNRAGNLRILYSLKTFMIKQLDFVRTEIVADLKSSDTFLRGLGRMTWLTFSLSLFGAGADALKDFIRGRPFDLWDSVVDNILRRLFFSKFQFDKSLSVGLARAVLEGFIPPTKVFDAFYKDVVKFMKDPKNILEIAGTSQSVRSVPVVGELYFWWFGSGREKAIKEQKKADTEKKGVTKLGT